MIDWSKPIRVKETKLPARVVADIIKWAKPCKVVLYEYLSFKEECVTTLKLESNFVENIPEEIEKEVYLTLFENGYVAATVDKTTAKIHGDNRKAISQKIERIKFIKGEFQGVATKV